MRPGRAGAAFEDVEPEDECSLDLWDVCFAQRGRGAAPERVLAARNRAGRSR